HVDPLVCVRCGLVHIPVALYPAEQADELDFTMLDRRDLQPVGYKRYNKATGDEVPYDRIVKGYEYEEGRYVTLEKEDFKRANVEASQTIDIVGFVNGAEIPPFYYESPYYTAPAKHGEKGYALLCETLERSGKVAIANVVIRTRQHLAMLYPRGRHLILNTLRYQEEIRPAEDIDVPESLGQAKVRPNELKMAERLIDDMTMKWDPSQYRDTYREDLMKMIEEKAQGHLKEAPKAKRPREAEVIDFATLLEKSLAARKRGEAANDEEVGAPRRPARKRAAAKARRKHSTARGTAHHRRAA
ncbi:MAG TPA: Ku protein, partial [Usitatibacter sp.]|nr:Ku protein [Usitatibacter sp.]